MLHKIKVFLLRWLHRMFSAWAWRSWESDVSSSALEIPTDAGPLSLRHYANKRGADKPLIVYFHGGGWVIGDLETHHPFCQALCAQSACTVVSVDYRLAPEHRYPAAHDDCLDATQWLIAHLPELGPNNGKVVLAGDSAGANLATCTCLALDAGERSVTVGELLIYPTTDHYSTPFPSSVEKATGYRLTTKLMHWFWDTYAGKLKNSEERNEGTANQLPLRATPLKAENIASLPSTFLITAENDPIRDEGIAYADKLRDEGVALHYRHFEQAQHGFACSEGETPDFQRLMNDITRWLDKLA